MVEARAMFGGVLATAFVMGSPTLAQTASATSDSPIETVLVSAQKRAVTVSAQSVPAALTSASCFEYVPAHYRLEPSHLTILPAVLGYMYVGVPDTSLKIGLL